MRPAHGIAVAFGLLFAGTAHAQTLTYGPVIGRGVTPDKMIVKWGTSSSAPATLYYRPHGSTVYQSINATASCNHSPNCDYEADLTGLAVGASYDYYVSPGGAAGSPFAFNSCPVAGTPMDLVFYGDSRSGGSGGGPTEHKKLVGLIQARNPDMVFESGDLYIDGSYGGYLSEFFPAVGTLGSTTPFMATPGNHDNDSGNLAANYGAVLPVPKQNPTDAWRAYYSFVCGNVMFIGLDSNQSGDATQKQWLQAQLTTAGADAAIDHVLVWFHHAPYSVGDHGDDPGTQSNWVSIFDGSPKVKAVFSGHDHLYAQMSNGSHVVYCVSGGAGAQPYAVQKASAATTVKAVSTYNYVLVHVAGKSLGATAYDDTNNVIDSWGAATTANGDGGAPPSSCPHTFSLPGTGMEQSVSVRGTFMPQPQGWMVGAPMTFDSTQMAWTASVDVPYNMPVEYKFHYAPDTWVVDPNNPSMQNGNSLLSGVTCVGPDMAVAGGETDMAVGSGDNSDFAVGPGSANHVAQLPGGCSFAAASGDRGGAGVCFVLAACVILAGVARPRRR